MPEPGPLPLRVLSRGYENLLMERRTRQLAAHEPAHRVISGGVPRRRVRRNGLHESLHLVGPTLFEHVIDPPSDALAKQRPRIDYKIARAPTGFPRPLAMQVAQSLSSE